MADSNNEIWVFLSHSNKDYENVSTSELGSFYIDDQGIVQRFEPSMDNPFIKEETVKEANYTFKTHKSIRTLIVPNGVKGFVSDFMRGIKVVEKFELPEGLISIGEDCFANSILPMVVIPKSVQEIRNFAFGHTHIDTLKLPATLHAPYLRQFKDSCIGTLRLPSGWEGGVSIGKYGNIELNGWWFNNDEYGYFRWPSTKIGHLEFY